MELDSHRMNPSSSSSVGTGPFSFLAWWGGSLFLPNAPPMSMRSCGSLSSPTAHITFCTLIEFLRPQILIIHTTPWRCARRTAPCGRPSGTNHERCQEGNHEGCPTRSGQSLCLLQRPRFLRQYDRDAVADRIRQFCRAGNQLLLLGIVFQRALGEGADEDFQKLWINAAGGSIGGHDVSWPLRGLVCPAEAGERNIPALCDRRSKRA